MEKEDNPMSDIQGKGFGSRHDWKLEHKYRNGFKKARYKCRICKCIVVQPDDIPNIFEAMYLLGIPKNCLRKEGRKYGTIRKRNPKSDIALS